MLDEYQRKPNFALLTAIVALSLLCLVAMKYTGEHYNAAISPKLAKKSAFNFISRGSICPMMYHCSRLTKVTLLHFTPVRTFLQKAQVQKYRTTVRGPTGIIAARL